MVSAVGALLIGAGCQSLSTIDVAVTPATLDRAAPVRAWYVEVQRRWRPDGARWDLTTSYARVVCDDDPLAFVVEMRCAIATELVGTIWRLPDRTYCDSANARSPLMPMIAQTRGERALELGSVELFERLGPGDAAAGDPDACALDAAAVAWDPPRAPAGPWPIWDYWRDPPSVRAPPRVRQ